MSLQAGDQVETISDAEQDLFESTYKELRKWVDVKSSRYGIISVIRERRSRRLGLALKVCSAWSCNFGTRKYVYNAF